MKYLLFWGILTCFTAIQYCQIKPIIPDEGRINYIPESYWELDSNNNYNKLNKLSFQNSLKYLMKSPFQGKLIPFRGNYLSDENLVSANDFSSIIKNNVNLSEYYRLNSHQESPELTAIRKYLGISKNVFAFILLIMHILAYY